jgi:hypothetical protein
MPDIKAPSPASFSPSNRRGLIAFAASIVSTAAYFLLGSEWALLLGAPAAAWSAYVLIQAIIHSRLNLGKRWALAALLLSGVSAYMALGDVAEGVLWRRAFQLTPDLAVYEEPVEKWRVGYPRLWDHQQHGVSGTLSTVFKPSKITPAMQFSVTRRAAVGTEDLSLIVEGFFMNLPKGSQTEILEKEPVTYPTGHKAYRVVYAEMSRRIPLKSEILFLLEKGDLYFLSVEATPRWFDRHRPYLEKLLYSLELPASS